MSLESAARKVGKSLRTVRRQVVYTDINSYRTDRPREIREDVTGFSAIIFQHEADHPDGILYTDFLN